MRQHVAQSSLAGAGGINDDNKERVVKGEVGDPSKAQPLVSKHTFAVAATATHAVDVVGQTVVDTLQTFLTRSTRDSQFPSTVVHGCCMACAAAC